MRKKLSAFACAVVLALCAACGLAGCDDIYATVPDERTAYDVAVENGYAGTLDTWLSERYGASSRELQWYEEAVATGDFTGTFQEFLAQIGASENNGVRVANETLLSVVSVYSFHGGGVTLGSGVIYAVDEKEDEALVLTNYHVLYSTSEDKRSDDIVVYAYGNETYSFGKKGDGAVEAEYIVGSISNDLALLKISYGALLEKFPLARPAQLGNSDTVTVGESVFVTGNAVGKGLSVTKGIVSVEYELLSGYGGDGKTPVEYAEIRTDAAVNHGNSGGGLFNSKGQLIGLVNARLEQAGDKSVSGIGYAFPINCVQALVENMLFNGGVHLTRLGFETTVLQTDYSIDGTTGKIYIQDKIVLKSTATGPNACYSAGLRNGDTLISATLTRGGQTVGSPVFFTRTYFIDFLLYRVCKDDTLVFTVSREGETLTIPVPFDRSEFFTPLP